MTNIQQLFKQHFETVQTNKKYLIGSTITGECVATNTPNEYQFDNTVVYSTETKDFIQW